MRFKPTWRGLRWISQAAFFILFVVLAARTSLPRGFNREVFDLTKSEDLRLTSPVGFFFELDPLAAVSNMAAGWTIDPALWISLIVLLATLVFGRVFCGFVCPFGAANHAFTQIGRKVKLSEAAAQNAPRPSRRWKYYLLILLLAGAMAGANLAGLFDPLALLYRGLVLAVFPAVSILVTGLSVFFAGLPNPLSYLGYVGPFVFDPVLGYGPRFHTGVVLIGGLFIGILLLNRIRPRFFCRALCPLGGLLGLFSRWGLLHLTKDKAKCNNCGLCRKDCQGASGPHPDEAWLRSECHVCFNCQAACPEGALKFKFQPLGIRPEPTTLDPVDAPDLGRRTVLASLAGGLVLAGLGRSAEAGPDRPRPDSIRPPGSRREAEFLNRCIRCGLCMKVCPTNVLTPALYEAGFEGLWTPVLKFNLGYCEYNCTLCSSVCPTGAIREITGKERAETPIVIGSAAFDRGRCLPWSGQGPCLVCEEHCPVSPKAIYLVPIEVYTDKDKVEKLMAPQVNLERCVGCGICAYKCPVKGQPAVYVTSVGETRSPGNRILLPGGPGGDGRS